MARGPKTKIEPTSLGVELLLAWMTREKVSQQMLADCVKWSQTRVHRVLKGSEPSVGEAFQIEKLTDGEVSARMWTYEPSGIRFEGKEKHAKRAVGGRKS